MATFRKRGSKWQVLIRRKDAPHISKHFTTKEAATEWSRETEVNIEKGLYANTSYSQRMTLRELLAEYRDRVAITKKGYRTEAYRINKIRRNKVCDSTLFKLTKLKLLKFREEQLENHSPATCNKYISVISMAIAYAMDDLDMYLPSNPAKRVKNLKEPEYSGEIITRDEEARLLEHAGRSKYVWLKCAIMMAIDLGARRGELINLKYRNIDFIRRTATLEDTKNGSDRTIGLTSRVIEEIKKLPRNVDGRVITATSGDNFFWAWKQCRRWAGVTKRFHCTRATFCTRAAEDNWQLLDIAAQTGHKDVNVLRKHYAKMQGEHLAKKLNGTGNNN
jgi:integrase